MQRESIISVLLFLVLIPFGGLGGILLSYKIAYMIFPDPCIYHTKEEPKNILFTLFFDYNSLTGYHPEPSIFSMIFYTMVGAIIGIVLARYLRKFFRPQLKT